MSRRYLFRLFAAAVTPGDHVPDRELLRRFVATRDSAAFELVVRRHADAVWAAAVRIVGNEADAEDVFQATFLALLRKAGSVRETCVGGWLHRVAVNAALKAKARRTPTVREGVNPPEPIAPELDPDADERAAIVHQELARLPDRYRLPVVLCDLEGQSHAEAAKSLGWPVGSVSGRLSRARNILRDRLARRGLGAPAALVVTAPASAVSAATALAAGSLASPAVSSLAEGVLSAMRITKLKLTAAVVAAGGFVALAGVGTVYALTQVPPPRTQGEPPPKAPQSRPPGSVPPPELPRFPTNRPADQAFTAFPELKKPDPNDRNPTQTLIKTCPLLLGNDPPAQAAGDDMYRRLLKARLHQGRLYFQKNLEAIAVGNWNPMYFSELLHCLDDMRSSALELWANDAKALVPWLEEFVLTAKYMERFAEVRIESGNDPPQNLYAARRQRLAAEAALWKARNAQRQGGR
jgi:RNA polymerase sigma factor (sigma-70 family)